MDSHLTGFEQKLQAGEIDKWKWVVDDQTYRGGLGLCVRAGETDLEVGCPSQTRLFRPRSSPGRERSDDHRKNGIVF